MRIAVCVKWVDTRPEVDALTGDVDHDLRRHGASAADRAAVETALRLAECWTGSDGVQLDLVTVAPVEAEPMLAELGATGHWNLHRVSPRETFAAEEPHHEGESSASVAASLAAILGGHGGADMTDPADIVVCGDHSLDRGSGAVPAFLAARLGAAQALGLVAIEPIAPGEVIATRRLGAGRAERLSVRGPAVLSVEGSVAALRRAPLAAVLKSPRVERHASGSSSELGEAGDALRVLHRGPLRPRTRVVAPPHGADALTRITELTGALVDRTPPRTVEATPDEAADLVLAQLRSWGYVD